MSHDETESKATIAIGLVIGVVVDVGGCVVLYALGAGFPAAFLLPILPAVACAWFFGSAYRPWPL